MASRSFYNLRSPRNSLTTLRSTSNTHEEPAYQTSSALTVTLSPTASI